MSKFRERFPYKYYNHLDKLTSKEYQTIIHYYGLGTNQILSISQIAELQRGPGVSSETVRQQLQSGLYKLRKASSNESNSDSL